MDACIKTSIKDLAVVHGSQDPQPIEGFVQWVTANFFASLNPTKLNAPCQKNELVKKFSSLYISGESEKLYSSLTGNVAILVLRVNLRSSPYRHPPLYAYKSPRTYSQLQGVQPHLTA